MSTARPRARIDLWLVLGLAGWIYGVAVGSTPVMLGASTTVIMSGLFQIIDQLRRIEINQLVAEQRQKKPTSSFGREIASVRHEVRRSRRADLGSLDKAGGS